MLGFVGYEELAKASLPQQILPCFLPSQKSLYYLEMRSCQKTLSTRSLAIFSQCSANAHTRNLPPSKLTLPCADQVKTSSSPISSLAKSYSWQGIGRCRKPKGGASDRNSSKEEICVYPRLPPWFLTAARAGHCKLRACQRNKLPP